jgi:TetR/AcrR family transcriptional regulator
MKLLNRNMQKEATRSAVIASAIELFAARGFDGTTLPAITSQCGVPVPLIIYHFKSKDALWRDAVGEIYQRFEAHIMTYAPAISIAKGIDFYRENMRAFITGVAAHPEYMRILFQEGTQKSERLTWLVDTHQSRITAMLSSLIQRAKDDDIMPDVDVIHAKFLLSGALTFPLVLAAEYQMVTGIDPQSPEFLELHIETCLRMFVQNYDV